ncbi:MAG: translational GTPase TypA [Mobiluncus porci]|uniref:translational GTPase TypA n=1 Tax=Mobiluncus porci TaxID=2652278 RepID=UPI0023F086A8|nr:translational GTPase TypA [Mobiluncus porci]MDD7542150.1 translational GTPase TypA [Mobiluncus porci]MDY5749009.1 translational GTPase TypA [Mobiluncus porci]
MTIREDIRNVAIVAHVDHGKTTLVDAMLRQANAEGLRADTPERVMDSGDLEREKGITILAKNTAVKYRGPAAAALGLPDGVTINVVDTPGHADFGGEVERGLSMVDGVVLLVDASEGPLPQTRFVLRKALAAALPVVLVINKVDRPDARIEEVVSESTDLLLTLATDLEASEEAGEAGLDLDLDQLLDLPIIYASAKSGAASLTNPGNGGTPDGDLECLFEAILKHIPGPTYDPAAPLQAHVTNLDASPFLGRLALLRIHNGKIHQGQTVGWARSDGMVEPVKITELLVTHGLDRVPTESASAGDIVAVAGIDDITIGESLVDLEDPRPLPLITVDEPAISMTIGINTSPFAGKVKGAKVTARQVKDRLNRELVGNVSLRVKDIGRPDAWEVQGRGELALAILVEQMRREGYELTAGKPQVVTRVVDGKTMEPMEALTVDVPEEYLGTVTQLMAARKGTMKTVANHGTGWVRLEFSVPARGLIGFRTKFLTETRGTGIASSVSAGWEPWVGEIEGRATGSLVADRAGQATPYAMIKLQERGSFIVQPGSQVYEGQVVGENPRGEDMIVNITKEKQQTNMRSSTADAFEGLTPPRVLTLEESLEFAGNDECVEVTPEAIRVRKVILGSEERYKAAAAMRREAR